jgi:beta-N-acetylhexosaminidase
VPKRGRSFGYAARLAAAALVATPLACASGAGKAAPDVAPVAPTSPIAPIAAATPSAPVTSPALVHSPATPACHPASLQRQAAETLIVGLPDTVSPNDPLAISAPELGVGGILLESANVQSADQIRTLIAAIRSRRGGPLLVATDEEGGRVTSFSSVIGWEPSARASSPLGPAALQQRAKVLGQQLRSLGVTVDFAPDLDVTGAPDDAAIGDRSYSNDPATASADALAVARGLSDGGITPVIKHFPGLGAADANTDVSSIVVNQPEWSLLYRDMRPFIDAINAGAPAVMVGHAQYPTLGDPTLPASLSPVIYQKLRAIPFHGVTITDSLGAGAVNLRFDFPVAAVKALQAGVDGLLTTDANQALRMRDAIVAAVETHQLSAARLADAAAHITALAGGDPYALTCLHVSVPKLH